MESVVLLEDGDTLALETGDAVLTEEQNGTTVVAIPIAGSVVIGS